MNDEIRANWEALEAALGKEMNFSTGGTASLQGILKQGGARCFFQDTAPTTRADGSAFASTDLGMLWIDSNSSPDNQLNILTATTPTWTPVSTEIIAALLAGARVFASTLKSTGNFTVGANKVVITAATGNTAIAGLVTIAGALGVTGIATLGNTSKLATSAAPTADAQLANKKYVDDRIAAGADPSYSGGQSHTFPGGLIFKGGVTGSIAGGGSTTVTFGSAFGTLLTASATQTVPNASEPMIITARSASSITIKNASGAAGVALWQAWGN